MSQSHQHSILESFVNVLIGYGVAFVSQLVVFPWYGINVPIRDNLAIGLWFTVISLIRSYAVRRYFNFMMILSKED